MRNLRLASILVAAVLVTAACGTGPVQPPSAGAQYVGGEILVKYLSGVQPTATDIQAVRGASLRTALNVRLRTGEFNLALVRVPVGQEAAYIEEFRQRPEVQYADFNFRVFRIADVAESVSMGTRVGTADRVVPSGAIDWTTVTDPKFWECDTAFEVTRLNGQVTRCTPTERSASWQWDLWRTRVPQAWQLADGAGVIVAVTDEGVDTSHPEFAGRLVRPTTGCMTDTVDWDRDPNDSGGHGTHVAGTVAAGINGQGVVGVAPRARILPIRVLGPLGGTTFTVVSGMMCAAAHGAKVVNASWGSTASSKAEEDALRTLVAAGVTPVFAAGNAFNAGNPRIYPAAFAETIGGVIAVGASTPTDRIASFSSSGPWVTVAAPGTTIYSTLPVMQGSYGFLAGTSMSAPHVSGVVALMLSENSGLIPQQIKTILKNTAFAPCADYPKPDYAGGGSCGGYTPGAGAYGWGIVDARAAVERAGP
jgi:subtilisin family serine protease